MFELDEIIARYPQCKLTSRESCELTTIEYIN